MFRNNSPFTNSSPRPGGQTRFTDSEGREVGPSGTKPATTYVVGLTEYFFSTELPLKKRHLFLGSQSGAFYGNAYCCRFSSASSTPHPVLNHYEIALLFLKSTIQCNWKEIFESAFAFVFVTCVIRHLY